MSFSYGLIPHQFFDEEKPGEDIKNYCEMYEQIEIMRINKNVILNEEEKRILHNFYPIFFIESNSEKIHSLKEYFAKKFDIIIDNFDTEIYVSNRKCQSVTDIDL